MNFLKHVTRPLAVFCLIITEMSLGQAAPKAHQSAPHQKEVRYTGQNVTEIQLGNQKTVTRYRTKQVRSTCTRQVPYQERVCGPVTRYRQECRTVPGENVCRDVPDQICRTVTRYRQECYQGPSRQQCHWTPGHRVCRRLPPQVQCRRGPGRQICSSRPRRQVCRNRPGRVQCRRVNGRRVCRTVGGGRSCRWVGGGRNCRTVPGRRICRTVPGGRNCHWRPGRRRCTTYPGQQICRQVPYEAQECTPTTRRQCEWIPERRECKQVPYTVNECRMETRHRAETYACMKTVKEPYTVVLNKYQANIKVEFHDKTTQAQAKVKVALNSNGKILLSGSDQSNRPVLIRAKKFLQKTVDGKLVKISGIIKVTFLDRGKLLSAVSKPIHKLYFAKKHMSFNLGKTLEGHKVKIQVQITRKNKTFINRTLSPAHFNLSQIDSKTTRLKLIYMGFKLKWRHRYNLRIRAFVELDQKNFLNLGKGLNLSQEMNKTRIGPRWN